MLLQSILMIIGLMVLGVTLFNITHQKPIVTPLADNTVYAIESQTIEYVEVPQENIDTWVGKYVDQYFPKPVQGSEMRMIIQCLLNRESKHDVDKGHGDGGLAGGPLQFHQATWDRMRKQMIESGEATETGSRYDQEQAIKTTVWAIKNGRALEWGPILRWSKGLYDQHACQVPSFYK